MTDKKYDIELRDYFAAKALQGMLSTKHWFGDSVWTHVEDMTKQYSDEAYLFADAMLKAREKND